MLLLTTPYNPNLNKNQIQKIGNIITYIFSKLNKETLSLKKVIKLLYFIDEMSVSKSGAPITMLKYQAWIQGPVPKDIFYAAADISKNRSNSQIGLENYIEVEEKLFNNKPFMSLSSKVEPNIDLITKYEIKIIDSILSKYGEWNGKQLEKETHKKGGLWDEVVEQNDLKQHFKDKKTSECFIDFVNLINDDLKKLNYDSSIQSHQFDNNFC